MLISEIQIDLLFWRSLDVVNCEKVRTTNMKE